MIARATSNNTYERIASNGGNDHRPDLTNLVYEKKLTTHTTNLEIPLDGKITDYRLEITGYISTNPYIVINGLETAVYTWIVQNSYNIAATNDNLFNGRIWKGKDGTGFPFAGWNLIDQWHVSNLDISIVSDVLSISGQTSHIKAGENIQHIDKIGGHIYGAAVNSINNIKLRCTINAGGVVRLYKRQMNITPTIILNDNLVEDVLLERLQKLEEKTSYACHKFPMPMQINAATPIISKELVITTKRGNPVFLSVSGDNNPLTTGSAWFNIKFYRNGTLLAHQLCEQNDTKASTNNPFSLQYLDVVAVGTYTYKVEFARGAGDCDLAENGAAETPQFIVYEI